MVLASGSLSHSRDYTTDTKLKVCALDVIGDPISLANDNIVLFCLMCSRNRNYEFLRAAIHHTSKAGL